MSRVPQYPELTDPALTDKMYIVDVGDPTDDDSGSSKHVTLAALKKLIGPEITTFNSADGAVLNSNVTGYSCVREGVGLYRVTFPAAAPAAFEQSLVGHRVSSGSSTAFRHVMPVEITTTSALFRVVDETNTLKDTTWTLTRTIG